MLASLKTVFENFKNPEKVTIRQIQMVLFLVYGKNTGGDYLLIGQYVLFKISLTCNISYTQFKVNGIRMKAKCLQ